MAFADPQTITTDVAAISCARTYTGTATGTFMSPEADTKLEIVTTVAKTGRRNHLARLSQKKTTADPLVGTVNVRVGDMVSLNINRPAEGYSDTEVLKQVSGFIAWLTAGTNANLKKLIAGEN